MLFPNALWAAEIFQVENGEWLNAIREDPNFILSPSQEDLYMSYSIGVLMTRYFQWALGFLVPMGTLLWTGSKIYALVSKDPEMPQTWSQSIKRPFTTFARGATSIFLLLLFTWGIPIGITAYFLPGIFLMVFGFFSFYSLLIDEKSKLDVIRGGIFYARDNFLKILVYLLIGFFLPWGLSMLFADRLQTVIFPNVLFQEWVNPATRNYLGLFLYYFLLYFFQNVLYFWFPVFYTVVFYDIQLRKIAAQKEMMSRMSAQTGEGIKTIEVQVNQKSYNCLVCGHKMPLGAKKCANCGELYRIVNKR